MQLNSSRQTAIVVIFLSRENQSRGVPLLTVHKNSHLSHMSRTTRLQYTRVDSKIAVCCRSEMVLVCTVDCVRSLNTGRENCAIHLRSSHQRSQWTMQRMTSFDGLPLSLSHSHSPPVAIIHSSQFGYKAPTFYSLRWRTRIQT